MYLKSSKPDNKYKTNYNKTASWSRDITKSIFAVIKYAVSN